jgi:hypothetical protein
VIPTCTLPRHRRSQASSLMALAGMAMLFAAAAQAQATHAAAAAVRREAGVRIAQAWIRWLPANLPAGGYLTLVNDGARPAVLVGASSPEYASVALHRTLSAGGTTRMVPIEAITIAPHSTLDFASLGYHLMLTQARAPVQPGQSLPLTLQFADGGTLQVLAAVKPPATASGMPGMTDMPGMSH